MNLTELKRKKMSELIHMGQGLNIENVSGMRRQDLIFEILRHHSSHRGEVFGDGVLETLPPRRDPTTAQTRGAPDGPAPPCAPGAGGGPGTAPARWRAGPIQNPARAGPPGAPPPGASWHTSRVFLTGGPGGPRRTHATTPWRIGCHERRRRFI